jgi:putative membrane protein
MHVIVAAAIGVMAATVPDAAFAHGAEANTGGSLQRVATLAVLALGVLAYARGVRRRQGRWPWWRTLAAAGGAVTIVVALLSPLEALTADSLTAHMVQHTLLILIAAPLLATGRPLVVLAAAMAPARLPAALLRGPSVGVACLLHGVALWVWHLPGPYDLTLRSALVHALAHLTLFGTAVLFWWSIGRGRARLAGALWLFVTAMHAGALGALLTLSPRPWFSSHPSLADQQLAGLVMWIPAGALLTALALIHLGSYLREGAHPIARVSVTLLVAAVGTLGVAGCDTAARSSSSMVGGDPRSGPQKIQAYGCQTCHTIPGVPGAAGTVGPPLDQVARRSYIAGGPNAPDRLVQFLRHPRQVRPGTPMPEMGVTEPDARDIAAYLYTLK